MTREEAIAYGKDYYRDLTLACCEIDEKHKEFVRMAIKALSQEPTKEEQALLQKWRDNRGISIEEFEDAMNTLQEPCDDAISREAAITIAGTHTLTVDETVKALEQLPSVTQKPIECDDAVSREWLMRKATERFYTTNYFNHISAMIEEAPSVTQKSGKWNEYYTSQKGNDVFNCKECGHTFVVTQGKDNMNYCPNCGAKMESEV